jgi:hypothetical protein
MSVATRNVEASKLLKDPYEVLGIGYKQFERSQRFLVKYFCLVAFLMTGSMLAIMYAAATTTGQGYKVPFIYRYTSANYPQDTD